MCIPVVPGSSADLQPVWLALLWPPRQPACLSPAFQPPPSPFFSPAPAPWPGESVPRALEKDTNNIVFSIPMYFSPHSNINVRRAQILLIQEEKSVALTNI